VVFLERTAQAERSIVHGRHAVTVAAQVLRHQRAQFHIVVDQENGGILDTHLALPYPSATGSRDATVDLYKP